MLSYLLGILIIVFFLLTLMTTSTTREGFAHESGGSSHGGSSHGGMGNREMGNREMGNRGMGSRQNDTLENAIGNGPLAQSNNQNQDSGKLNNILNNQPVQNIAPMPTMSQADNINARTSNNMNLQNERQQKNQRMSQELRQESRQELEQEMQKIRFQIPVRLEMELPYEQSGTETPKYSNNMTQIPPENNRTPGAQLENMVKKGDTNTKIKNIIKKSAELSFLALDNNKEPVSALKSSNYAIAYVSALQEIYTDDQIQNAANINLNQFKNELLKIQTTITANIKNTCSPSETDKQYLLKIINNI